MKVIKIINVFKENQRKFRNHSKPLKFVRQSLFKQFQ